MHAWDLIDLASEYGLSSIEIPLQGTLPDVSEATIDRLRAVLAERGLALVVDTGVVDVAALREVDEPVGPNPGRSHQLPESRALEPDEHELQAPLAASAARGDRDKRRSSCRRA